MLKHVMILAEFDFVVRFSVLSILAADFNPQKNGNENETTDL